MNSLARVVTVCQNEKTFRTIRKNRAFMLELLDRALKQKPDIVCLPEAFTTAGVPSPTECAADKFPGPTTDAVAKRAKHHRCYIICPINVKRDDTIYNSAIVFDRSGDVLGIYDKMHPVTTTHDYTSFEDGTTPGTAVRAFDLDFGRIGVLICFDAGFPETWAAMARKGAKLVFWPSAYTGGLPLQSYACLHRYYVVSSVRGDKSRIINPCGRIVMETDTLVNIAAYDLNLDFAICHYDFNFDIPDKIMDTYDKRIRIVSYVEDAHFLIEPMDPNISIRELQGEFGFELAKTYLDRHKKAYRRILASQKPLSQKALHGNRPPFGKQ